MTKRMICGLLAVLMLLGMVGCTSGDENKTEPVTQVEPGGDVAPTDGVTEPSVEAAVPDVTDPTEPSAEVTEPDVTKPTEAAPSVPEVTVPDATVPAEDVTEPGDIELPPVPVVTEPTDPPATEPVSSEPAVTEPDPTEPTATGPVVTTPPATEAPTEPPATEVDPTEPPETEPVPTEPPATEHVHDYSTKVIKPTCTKKGYTKYTCKCGDSYKGNYVDKVAHSYTSKVVKPTCEAKGYTLYTCSCGESYKDNYTPAGSHDYQAGEVVEATAWKEGYTLYTCSHCGDSYEGDKTDKIPLKEFERLVAEAVVKYINQYRVAQGDTEAQILPGLTLVAEYRAVQLTDNFEHSTKDLREAYAYYQYGEWIDMTEYGMDASYSHYTANAKEAIARGGSGSTPDEIGQRIANVFHNSEGHWSYLGSSDFPYIGIGVACDINGRLYTCTLQTRENYG